MSAVECVEKCMILYTLRVHHMGNMSLTKDADSWRREVRDSNVTVDKVSMQGIRESWKC